MQHNPDLLKTIRHLLSTSPDYLLAPVDVNASYGDIHKEYSSIVEDSTCASNLVMTSNEHHEANDEEKQQEATLLDIVRTMRGGT